MIGSNSRSSPGLARWAESYEVKCERRQEARESRRRRRNETTCRQPGKVLRTQYKEQLQRARQLQFLRRRNLEEEKKGQAKEQGPSRKTDGGTGQVSILKKSVPGASRTSFPGQQETGIRSEVSPALPHSSSGIQRDLDDHHASRGRVFPPQDSDTMKSHRHHQGTQTKAEEAWPTRKNDASQQTNCGVAVLDKVREASFGGVYLRWHLSSTILGFCNKLRLGWRDTFFQDDQMVLSIDVGPEGPCQIQGKRDLLYVSPSALWFYAEVLLNRLFHLSH